MKVFLFNAFDYGSTGTICGSLARAISENGGTAYLICGNKRHSGDWDYYVPEHTPKIMRFVSRKSVELLGHFSKDLSNYATKKVLKWIESKSSPSDKTVFHFHNMQFSGLNIASICSYASKKNIKTIFTLHDCWLLTGGCYYWMYYKCDRWSSNYGCRHCPQKFPFVQRELDFKKHIFKKTNAVIVSPCKWMNDNVSQSYLCNQRHLVIYNGIDPSFWNIKADTRDDNVTRLVSVAFPWTNRKGLLYLNQLASILPSNYSITIVGLSASDVTNNRITRLGKLSRDCLKKIYQSSDIFVNPTLEDNFPTVNIEALLCGLPICSFNTGGSTESFDESTGVVVQEKNALALLKGIEKIHLTFETREKCRKRGLLFNEKKMQDEYIKLYQEI